MKIFISACAAFFLSLVIVIFSSLYTNHAIDTTTEILSALPENIEESKNTTEITLRRIKEAENSWHNHSRVLGFFISHRELDEIDTLLVSLYSSTKSRDSGHYASTLSALEERLVKLSSSESFSVSSIF